MTTLAEQAAVEGEEPGRPRPDLGDPSFWQLPHAERLRAFALLRQWEAPQYFVERERGRGRRERGFHALVRHADVVEASRNPEVFASAPGATTPEPARWVRALFGDSLVNLDGPRHAQLRRIVSRSFTPRILGRTEEDIRAVAARIVDDVLAEGGAGAGGTGAGGGALGDRAGDFVTAVASRMPFEVICNLMGIPEAERPAILGQVNRASGDTGVARAARDRFRMPGKGLRALASMQGMVADLGRERRKNPTDDLVSMLVSADIDGQSLTGRQLGAFFSLLMVAGVETTRNAIAHGLDLLTRHPAQRALLVEDFDRYADGATEEIVRHSTPIIQFRRTLTRDHRMNGHAFRKGDKVVLFYASANRDEAVFTDPDAFDITRSPNPHVGYGGGGPHYCLGTYLAKQEMKALFRELLTRAPDLRATGAPVLVPSNFDNRVRSMPYALGEGGNGQGGNG
ncbi:cytochrome P450 [Streptomyces liangshanensis]|uniref:Cytochrome P450 n=1 Tax=Streptomyces liangshanensis TaxID=2717324 RepID=A0A6G9H222_9ACTN|nr:cytochrome P450 [Streptomyces liangshanensis]QIQ04329.1 cytochrome P450 [Streptomyces liangshanensis]